MIALLTFLGVTALLLLQGYLFARLVTKDHDFWLLLGLALPLSALTNVLVTAIFTVASVPLVPLSLLGAHAVLAGVLFFLGRKVRVVHSSNQEGWHSKIASTVSIIILTCVGIYAFSHAVLLPSFQYDSATNWTMRSQISFYDERMAFDATEERGMAKPQYPYLFHALQVTANQGQTEWNDTAANTILFLLALGCVYAMFVLLKRIRGSSQSLLTLALIFGTPLLAVHMAQGYGDSLLTEYILLGFTSTLLWIHSKEDRWLLLSALLMAAAVWTKAEGLFFGLVPWLLTIGYFGWREKKWQGIRNPALLSIVIGLTWTIGAVIAGLSLTPHRGSDVTLAPSVEAMQQGFIGLFDRGSFGMHWYGIVVALVLLFLGWRKNLRWLDQKFLGSFVMAITTFVLIWIIYTLTPNSQFLLKAESYYRQMLIPLGLFILSISVCINRSSREESRSE